MSAVTETAGEATVRLLAQKAGARASGILTVTDGKLKRLFCLSRGRLVFAASNLIEEQFGEVLVRDRLLAPGHRAQATVEAARQKKKLTAYLRDEEVLARDDLLGALERHVRTLLLSALESNEAASSFSDGQPKLDGEVLVDLSCVPLVLDHVREHPEDLAAVRVRIGKPNLKPICASDAKARLGDAVRDGAMDAVLRTSDGSRDLPTILSDPDVDGEAYVRSLYGLMLLGVVEAAEEQVDGKDRKEPAVTRKEALGRCESAAGADCYGVLGLDPHAEGDEIRESYYYLARRYHPDRFRSGELKDLIGRMEEYFTRVTDAYNTLIDPDLRRAYDDELASKSAGKKDEPQAGAGHLALQNFLRAKVLIGKRKLHDALTFLENAVKLAPDEAEYHLELGQVLARNPRRRADAERHLTRATELDPASPQGYFALGELLLKTDRVDEAARLFREVLRWDANHDEARDRLAQIAGSGRKGGRSGG